MNQQPQVDAMEVIEKIKQMPNGPLMIELAVEKCMNEQKDEIIKQLTAQNGHSDEAVNMANPDGVVAKP